MIKKVYNAPHQVIAVGVTMTGKTQNVLNPQKIKLYNQLCGLEKKEKQTYEALAALITYINGEKLEWGTDNFNKFKKGVLAIVGELPICKKNKMLCKKNKMLTNEPKFNVKHYERAILSASDVTYRDMAIQAANKDLTEEAMVELIAAISRDCRQISRKLKEITTEWRKCQVPLHVSQKRQNVIELDDKECVHVH
ncbi:MAG: hypothetical protein AB8Z23_00315 [Coxiella-like endosymbiont]